MHELAYYMGGMCCLEDAGGELGMEGQWVFGRIFGYQGKKTSQVLSPIIDSMAGAKVDILIDERTRQWNHELIEGIFIPEEADLIKTIPLSQQEAEDTLFWPFTHKGSYTSKSGYCFLKSEEKAEINDEQMERDRTLWRGIWSLQVPNKIKNLIWRACRNSLLTKVNLQCQTIIDNVVCDRCKLVPKSAIHALWSCTELDVVWEDV